MAAESACLREDARIGAVLRRDGGQRGDARDAGAPAETLAEFRAHVGDPTSPPGPLDTWLGETVVHSTDIRWSVGIEHAFAPETLARAADFHKASNLLIGAKNRIAGRTRRATDTDWTHGSGPEVTSPMLALVMAMTGRRAALERLSGSGLAA